MDQAWIDEAEKRFSAWKQKKTKPLAARRALNTDPSRFSPLKVLLNPEANLEIHQTALFYEDCRDGRGLKILDANESAFEQIQ